MRIEGLVYEVGVLEEADTDIYDEHNDNIDSDECADGNFVLKGKF